MGVGRVGQPEAVDPAVAEPRGLLTGQVRHLVVLLARQVPDEPRDVVRLGVRTPQQLVDGEAVDHLRHALADAAEAVEQQVAQGAGRHVVHQPSMHLGPLRRSEPGALRAGSAARNPLLRGPAGTKRTFRSRCI